MIDMLLPWLAMAGKPMHATYPLQGCTSTSSAFHESLEKLHVMCILGADKASTLSFMQMKHKHYHSRGREINSGINSWRSIHNSSRPEQWPEHKAPVGMG